MNSIEFLELEIELKRAKELIKRQGEFINEKLNDESANMRTVMAENKRLKEYITTDPHRPYHATVNKLRDRIHAQTDEIRKLLEEKENAYSDFKMKSKKSLFRTNRFGINVKDGYQKSFVKIVKDWVKKGMNYEEIKTLAYARNATFFPPLNCKELEAIIKNVWRKSE